MKRLVQRDDHGRVPARGIGGVAVAAVAAVAAMVALAGLAVLVASSPAAAQPLEHGQDIPGIGGQAFLHYQWRPPAEAFTYHNAAESDACEATFRAASASEATVAIESDRITFHERETDMGCGEVVLEARQPIAACRVAAHFAATREVSPSTTSLQIRSAFVQQLRMRQASGWEAQDYFDPLADASPDPVNFSFGFDLSGCTADGQAAFSWLFADQGLPAGGPVDAAAGVPGAAEFGAQLSRVLVEFQGVPFEDIEASQRREGIHRDAVQHSVVIRLAVPDLSELELQPIIVLKVPERWVSDPLRPNTFDESNSLAATVDGWRVLVLNATTDQGQGLFEVHLISSKPLSQSRTMLGVMLVFIALPAASGLLAVRNVNVYDRQAKGSFKPAGRRLRLATYLVWLGYFVVLASILYLRLPTLMGVWPMEREQGMAYLMFMTLTVSFISVSFLAKRQETRTLGYEIQERERVQRELERSNEELEQFAYVASHDLQEPLRMVASYTRLLQKRYGGRLDEDADTFIGYAVEGAERMQAMIHDLLSYSRVASRPPERIEVDLNAVMAETVLMLESRITQQDAKVTYEALPTVRGDRGLLAHVLQNLVGNGIKFRRDEPPRVHVSATRDGPAWRITVQDNGIGIEERHLQRIFLIFQRLHARDKYEGTGIGLALCQKIVARHGGSIWVDSSVGQGSAFHFTLPDRP